MVNCHLWIEPTAAQLGAAERLASRVFSSIE
jgi:hypothetical protein